MKYPTQEEIKSSLIYTPDTGIFYWRKTLTSRAIEGKVAGRINDLGYCVIGLAGQKLLAHRLAWIYMTGSLPNESIDHINSVRNDNRWANLRIADRYGQAHNQKIRKSNSTGKKGVYSVRGKFSAAIRANGSGVIRLGEYETLDEAAHAYNRAAIHLHREFACLNPIGADK